MTPNRILSLVPSWTETLLAAGVHVVGRTRYCIHPAPEVDAIPIVGGTKDWHLDRITALSPDLVLLDAEENPRPLADALTAAGIPWHATAIHKIADVAPTLHTLADLLDSRSLAALAARWATIAATPAPQLAIDTLPGILAWGRRPTADVRHIVYVIWKDPWMAVSHDTFIGSVLTHLGLGDRLVDHPTRYSEIDLATLPPDTLLLLSSEPYPFLRKRDQLTDLPFPHAFVDGESFSWFGARTLAFLEAANRSTPAQPRPTVQASNDPR